MSPRHRRNKKSPGKKSKTEFALEESIYTKPTVEPPICPMCNEPIRDIYLSLVDGETGEAVHFDCALKSIRAKERIEEGEAVVYLGSGCFGILDRPPGSGSYTIRKRIQFEQKEKAAAWRRTISFSA
ncbi:MAG TPA: hypothetical protein PLG79_05305 [Spirochaetales bacterium]|mgnify:CR=1 FL=1|nr:hypothetical protein [Spirochaetales bacterium]